MYKLSARLYGEIYARKENKHYGADVSRLHASVQERKPDAVTLLDVACGTGLHLELLQAHYRVAGLDVSPEMLAVARERLPDAPLRQADMRDFDLGQTFDTVTCLFSSIGYAITADGLRRTIASFARHLNVGGVAIVEAWLSPDVYEEGRVSLDVVADEPRRKIARTIVSKREGSVSVLDMHILVGTSAGVEHIGETHRMGLFTVQGYEEAFRQAGLTVEHDPEGLMGRGLYVGIKRS